MVLCRSAKIAFDLVQTTRTHHDALKDRLQSKSQGRENSAVEKIMAEYPISEEPCNKCCQIRFKICSLSHESGKQCEGVPFPFSFRTIFSYVISKPCDFEIGVPIREAEYIYQHRRCDGESAP